MDNVKVKCLSHKYRFFLFEYQILKKKIQIGLMSKSVVGDYFLKWICYINIFVNFIFKYYIVFEGIPNYVNIINDIKSIC